ncbi:MAG: hypothetical protein WBB74_01390 [Gaiellaceae bacterium]
MAEATSRAKLVDAARDFNGSGVTATIPRSEVEAALRSKKSPELFLDVARVREEGGADVEAHRVSVAWDKKDLEKLLKETKGDQIDLQFDRKELEQALEADVEGHGMRERALILTVAATAAAGIAGGASARPFDTGGNAPAAIEMISDAASSGVQATAPATQLVSDAASSVQQAPAATGLVSDAASSGAQATPQATAQISDAASSGVQATSEATPLISDAGSGGLQSTPQATAQVSDAALSGSPAAHAASEATPLISDSASSPQAAQPSSSGGGIDISAPSPSTAGIAGGIALLITGAGFALRGQRRRVPKPT